MKRRWKTTKRRRRQYFLKQRMGDTEGAADPESACPQIEFSRCLDPAKKPSFPLSLRQMFMGVPLRNA